MATTNFKMWNDSKFILTRIILKQELLLKYGLQLNVAYS